MCFYWQEVENADASYELRFDEIETLSEKMGKFIQLSIGGGEPTLRDDLPEICYLFCKNNHIRYITLPTNGINTDRVVLHTRKILDQCTDTHLRISLSLDGPPNIHDGIRGGPGGYEKLMNTYHALTELKETYENLSIDIVTVLQSVNQDTILDLFRTVHRTIKPDNHMLLIARGDVQNNAIKQVRPEIYENVISLTRKMYRRSESRPFSSIIRAITERSLDIIYRDFRYGEYQTPCVAGRRLVVVSEDGEVRPCEILHTTFGNLREFDYDLNAILKTGKARSIQKQILKKKCHCTFECAVNINVFYDWRGYLDLMRRAWRIKRKTGHDSGWNGLIRRN